LIASGVHIVTQHGIYDFGWLRADADIKMPPSDRLEEIGALATLIDENRFSYSLDSLCAWRNLPGKDTALLREAIKTAGWAPRKRSINIAEHIYKLPAHLVGPYAEADASATLALFEDLNPILDREGTRNAYRLEVDLLPMVHEMRRRGIRIDQSAAERARDYCLQKRDRALAELSQKLDTTTGMEDIASPKWKARTFGERYRNDPDTDFHALAGEITGLSRANAKHVNFAKIYGAGVKKFAEMIHRPLSEAQAIYQQYDRRLPFVPRLAAACQREAKQLAHTVLYDGARRHWDRWAPKIYSKGAGPCSLEEAKRRTLDPAHPWFDKWLQRVDIHTALNALIQGSAARHTKLWMRACWREGIVPLLQMHDALDCSVTTREQGELIARLGCEVVALEVPMRVDLKFGKSWGDATHGWDELHGIATPTVATEIASTQPEIGISGWTEMPNDSDFRTGGLPTNSQSDHNLAAAENDANAVEHIDTDELPSTPEPAHVCAQCHLNPPDGSERPSAYNELWLHARCEDAFICARMAEEGLMRSSQSTSTPSPDNQPPHSSGNGHATDEFDDTATKEFAPDRNAGNGYARGEAHKGATAAAYIYKDATGRNHMRVVRTTAKTFPTYHWDRGAWMLGWPKHVVPYRLPELIAAPPNEPVWICEGEKDANNVAALGLIATTNPGGAGKWQHELTQWFKDKEIVYLLEDNDEPGRKHTAIVTAALRDVVSTIVTLSFPELPEKGDVSDWLEIGGNRTLLIARAKIERERQSTQDVHIINLATVRSRAIAWLWPGHLARGGLELMAGTPEIGKSQIHCQYIAHLTTGRDWPNGMPGIAPCRVIMITAEDTAADTIVPRLKAAGANLDLVEQLHAIRRNGREEMFLLGEDLERLARTVRHFGDVGLIAIDPITAYMGSNKHFDSHRATDVRSQLMPLKRFAEEFGIAISAITHPPKNASAQALDHFIGSQAFIASARVGHLCLVEMEEDEDGTKIPTGRRLFTNPKINIAARQPTLAYSINVVDVEQDEETGVMIRAPVIQWEGEVAITAEEALAASRPTRGKGRKTVEVDEFLHDILTGGPVLVTVIKARAAAHGFSEDQLRRARERLNVIAFKEKVFGARSKWALPQHAPSLEEREDELDGKQK
jgi:AAA domain/DNA polymerase family A